VIRLGGLGRRDCRSALWAGRVSLESIAPVVIGAAILCGLRDRSRKSFYTQTWEVKDGPLENRGPQLLHWNAARRPDCLALPLSAPSAQCDRRQESVVVFLGSNYFDKQPQLFPVNSAAVSVWVIRCP